MSSIQRHNSTDIVEVDGGEIIDLRGQPSALEAITRAEIDIQISTAKRFPRSMQKFLQEAKAMVALDPDLADKCTYVLKDKKKQDGTPVSGPSVRLAEMLAVCWGNIRIVGRITDDDGKMITAQAVAIDLERNVGYSVETKRGVTTSPKAKYNPGARFSDDMVRVTCNAAIAIATRNVTFKVIPMAFVNLIEDEARKVATGDIKTLPERTARAVAYFVGKGIAESAVYATLGIAGPADITLDLLQTLNGYKVAVNEGHATLSEIFAPPVAEHTPAATGPTRTFSEALANKLKPKPVEPPGLLPDEPGAGG
jgi:hypothetical protein